MGGNGTSNEHETPKQRAPSRGPPPIARGVNVVVEGVCLLVLVYGGPCVALGVDLGFLLVRSPGSGAYVSLCSLSRVIPAQTRSFAAPTTTL